MPRLPGDFEKGEQIGFGRHKDVFRNSNNENEIIKEFKVETDQNVLKGYFYLTKICHLLFPYIVPDIHFVFDADDKITIEDLVDDELHIEMAKRVIARKGYDKQELLKRRLSLFSAIKAIDDRLQSIGVVIDAAGVNFMVHKNEGVHYVEGIPAWTFTDEGVKKDYDPEKVGQAISKLSEPDRTRAQNYLKRLEELFEEAKKGSTPR